MSARRFLTALPVALVLCALPLIAGPASAFSQIGSEDGATSAKDGIVSVPLPPLAGQVETGAPVDGAGPVDPASDLPDGAPPPSGASEATPPASGGTIPPDEEQSTTPAGPVAPAAVESPEPIGTTDEGESETPDEPAPAPSSDPAPVPSPPSGGAPGQTAPLSPSENGGEAAVPLPPVPIIYGDEGLPQPVRDLRERLMTIARAGEIEALRPYIEKGEDATLLTFGGSTDDPITYLKAASGDGEGVEMLAIMLEVLQTGHVRNEPATDNEIFVWPYFTGVALDQLTKAQKVELFELVTAGDYQEMLGFGAYNFFRLGISPDGKLQFFVAGD